MENSIKIVLLCCNYTNLIEGEDVREILGRLEIWRFPCSGQIEITDMLRAFRMGADGVLVAGCTRGACHNGRGSERAERRVLGARKILEEIGIPMNSLEFVYVNRLDGGDFVSKAKAFYGKILGQKLEERRR